MLYSPDPNEQGPSENHVPIPQDAQLPLRRSLIDQLLQLLETPKEFIEQVEVIAALADGPHTNPDSQSPQMSLAIVLRNLLRRQGVPSEDHASKLECHSVLALASSKLLAPLRQFEAEGSAEIRFDLIKEILSYGSTVLDQARATGTPPLQYVEALTVIGLERNLSEQHFASLSDLNRRAITEIIGQVIFSIREDGDFPHYLLNGDLDKTSRELLGLVRITDKLRLSELFEDLYELLKEVHAWSVSHSERYGDMGGMSFGGTWQSENDQLVGSSFVEPSLGDFYTECLGDWLQYNSESSHFSVYEVDVVLRMEELVISTARALKTLSYYQSGEIQDQSITHFFESVLRDFRIGWDGWAPFMQTLMRLSEEGLAVSRELIDDQLIGGVLSGDLTATIVICELIEHDKFALQLVVEGLNALSKAERKELFARFENIEFEHRQAYRENLPRVWVQLRELTEL